ncbi:sodium-dependent transporter [Natronomonas salina]|uniref:sodium-dependent transporter n=1 Tax=Natronomonas salina TaxID=1710540 RepID=UPI0015B4DB74|nr:sodium-dependent transporter [Natronomonas salina]QLD91111.1 sodium-dependent transporter [Natronomonas salina]
MMQRETWATRIGFILAAVGSAVGLGNIWRFPFQTAENGGAAFLVVYIIAVLLIGIPAILAEFVIGRRSKQSAIGAFDALGRPRWRWVGAVGVLAGFWTLSYYSVVGGWVVRYAIGSVTGAYLGDPGTYFGAISAGPEAVAFHAVFMLVTIGIVAFGVESGIEMATKLMVPSIILLMLGLAVYAFTLSGSAAGYEYFLSPDFDALVANFESVIPAAVGQALFSLSLGYAVMITYASYIDRDENLGVDGLSIAITNTFVAVLAGLVVFPLLAAQGVDYGSEGPGAIFVTVPTAFADLPNLAARAIGFVFFFVVFIAALSSAISLLEVVTSHLVDSYDVDRKPIAVGLGVIIFVLGIPSAWDTAWLTWFDLVSVNLLLPVGVFGVVVFAGWILSADATDELGRGAPSLRGVAPVWLWSLRTIVLLAVLGTLVLSLGSLTAPPL